MSENNEPKKKHTFRNVVLILIAVFALFVVGCTVLVGTAANEVGKSIEKSEKADKAPGGPDNPLKVKEGEKFSVAGFDYDAGWKVVKDTDLGMLNVEGLKVTNNRDKKDSALVEVKFWKGNEVLALTDCTTEPVAVGTKTKVSCIGTDDIPKGYNKITINDSF